MIGELDPCPFCDAPNSSLFVDEVAPRVWAVCCDICKAIGPESTQSAEHAAELWCRDPQPAVEEGAP
jgi:hypothetical protein